MIGTTFDSATVDLVNDCITWAEDDIRKALSPRYDVSADAFQTSTSTPPTVQTMAKKLAVGYSYFMMGRGSKDMKARADMLIKPVMKQLDEIADFKQDLVDSSGDRISDRSDRIKAQSNTEDYTPTFGEDSPLDWMIDEDKLSDIDSSRD